MDWLIWFVAINWGAPLLFWLYPLVMVFVFRDLEFVGFHGPFIKFRLLEEVAVGNRVWWNGRSWLIADISGEFAYLSHPDGADTRIPVSDLNPIEPWHSRLWVDWFGVGLYGFMCYRNLEGDSKRATRTITHEGAHCIQWMIFGLMFLVIYLLHMLFIYFFQKSKHPYLDCWFERWARKRAGQVVDMPRAFWPQGPRDRWPWW